MRRARADRLLLLLAFAWAASGAGAADLGTLFHTPEERARLDALRRGEPPAPAGGTAPRAAREVTGYVQRSDGRSTVWIDGVPVPVTSPKASSLLQPNSVRAYSDRKEDEVRIERKPAPAPVKR